MMRIITAPLEYWYGDRVEGTYSSTRTLRGTIVHIRITVPDEGEPWVSYTVQTETGRCGYFAHESMVLIERSARPREPGGRAT